MVKISVLTTGRMLLFSLVTADKCLPMMCSSNPAVLGSWDVPHFVAQFSYACQLHQRRYYLSASFHVQLRSFVDCRLCRDTS
jgi:hypothetical protein